MTLDTFQSTIKHLIDSSSEIAEALELDAAGQTNPETATQFRDAQTLYFRLIADLEAMLRRSQ